MHFCCSAPQIPTRRKTPCTFLHLRCASSKLPIQTQFKLHVAPAVAHLRSLGSVMPRGPKSIRRLHFSWLMSMSNAHSAFPTRPATDRQLPLSDSVPDRARYSHSQSGNRRKPAVTSNVRWSHSRRCPATDLPFLHSICSLRSLPDRVRCSRSRFGMSHHPLPSSSSLRCSLPERPDRCQPCRRLRDLRN